MNERTAPEITIILVNYNTLNDTIECVRSIENSSIKPYVVIVDNCSTDGISEADFTFYNKISLIKNWTNAGFGRGNNIGIHWALQNLHSDYIFLLNNDTLIQADTLEKLIVPFSYDPDVALVTCKIMYHHDPSLVWYGGGDINIKTGRIKIQDMGTQATAEGADKSRIVSFASGCAMMFKTDVLARLKGFDDRLFMYVEDLELCLRLNEMGFKIWYTADTSILHKVHGSSNKSEKKLPGMHKDNPKVGFYTYHMVKNTLLTMRKHLKGHQWVRFLVNYMAKLSYKNLTFLSKFRLDGTKATFRAIADFVKEK